jgi:iron complex outermembrane receptor protein
VGRRPDHDQHAVFYSDIKNLQANVDAGSCSSRIVVNVPEAHTFGIEAELFARPTENWDFSIGATWVEAEIDSSRTGTGHDAARRHSQGQPAAHLSGAAGYGERRLHAAGLQQPGRASAYSRCNTWARRLHSSPIRRAPFGQIGGAGPPFIPFGDPTIDSFTFDPELPSYEIGNLRVGVRSEVWETRCSSTTCGTNGPSCRSIASAARARVSAISPICRARSVCRSA